MQTLPPIGSDCFATLRPGWFTGYRGTLLQYVKDSAMGDYAILAIGEPTQYGQRTIRTPIECLMPWTSYLAAK